MAYSAGYSDPDRDGDRHARGRAVPLRSRNKGGIQGNSRAPQRGMAGSPQMGGRHAGAGHGMGFQQGKFAASPFGGRHARNTGGYKGVGGDYAAASPNVGFVLNGRGGR